MRTYSSYDEYLQSPPWRSLRAQSHQRDGYRCRLCNSRSGLQVHHRRYAQNWGEETVDDLTTLCARCHAIYSGFQPYPPPGLTFLWGLGFGAVMAAIFIFTMK